MGVRSYVLQIGRFLPPDPVPGGSANAYFYTFQDPVNSTDPREEWEEEGEYEYASYHGAESGKEDARVEPAVLYQAL
jgi:hypothetical protein